MKKLKELRKSKNMTMEELANKVGVQKSSISLYENGKINPSLEVIKNIANIFNVSINYLLDDDLSTFSFKEEPPKENTITVVGRGGKVEEVQFTDEEISAFKTLFKDKFNKN